MAVVVAEEEDDEEVVVRAALGRNVKKATSSMLCCEGCTRLPGGWYGGRELEKGEPVVICAEGKEEACAVGLLSMGTKEVKEKGKGPVVEEGHYLGDGLWRLGTD